MLYAEEGDKLIDSVTLAEILKVGHEVAKADRFMCPQMQIRRDFGIWNIERFLDDNRMTYNYAAKLEIEKMYGELME
jgi:hypothetical protein